MEKVPAQSLSNLPWWLSIILFLLCFYLFLMEWAGVYLSCRCEKSPIYGGFEVEGWSVCVPMSRIFGAFCEACHIFWSLLVLWVVSMWLVGLLEPGVGHGDTVRDIL